MIALKLQVDTQNILIGLWILSLVYGIKLSCSHFVRYNIKDFVTFRISIKYKCHLHYIVRFCVLRGYIVPYLKFSMHTKYRRRVTVCSWLTCFLFIFVTVTIQVCPNSFTVDNRFLKI